MKYIIQSKWIGDTKWNFRAEAKNLLDLAKQYDKVTRQDARLRVFHNNTYQTITIK